MARRLDWASRIQHTRPVLHTVVGPQAVCTHRVVPLARPVEPGPKREAALDHIGRACPVVLHSTTQFADCVCELKSRCECLLLLCTWFLRTHALCLSVCPSVSVSRSLSLCFSVCFTLSLSLSLCLCLCLCLCLSLSLSLSVSLSLSLSVSLSLSRARSLSMCSGVWCVGVRPRGGARRHSRLMQSAKLTWWSL